MQDVYSTLVLDVQSESTVCLPFQVLLLEGEMYTNVRVLVQEPDLQFGKIKERLLLNQNLRK